MASYNYLNGLPACENKHLLTDILRNDWKYEGLVMSDWGACVDLPECISAGMDVEMPDSCGNHYDEIWNIAATNPCFMKKLECSVDRIERLTDRYKSNVIQSRGKKNIPDPIREKNHKLAEQIAEESIVLLKMMVSFH